MLVDPHIWFDLDLWKQALDAAVEELKEYSPEDADFFEENKQEYFAKIDQLKQEAEKLAEIPKEQRVLVTAHDAFGYFGRMHDLEGCWLARLKYRWGNRCFRYSKND